MRQGACRGGARFLSPITMAAARFLSAHGRNLRSQAATARRDSFALLTSFLAAGIAGFFGAMLVKNAPVEGGRVIHLMHGE